jgi:hypothetical protein
MGKAKSDLSPFSLETLIEENKATEIRLNKQKTWLETLMSARDKNIEIILNEYKVLIAKAEQEVEKSEDSYSAVLTEIALRIAPASRLAH